MPLTPFGFSLKVTFFEFCPSHSASFQPMHLTFISSFLFVLFSLPCHQTSIWHCAYFVCLDLFPLPQCRLPGAERCLFCWLHVESCLASIERSVNQWLNMPQWPHNIKRPSKKTYPRTVPSIQFLCLSHHQASVCPSRVLYADVRKYEHTISPSPIGWTGSGCFSLWHFHWTVIHHGDISDQYINSILIFLGNYLLFYCIDGSFLIQPVLCW